MINQSQDCYLILSLDGGGVRGALQARILARLQETIPFLHKVKLVCGSSIGGINGLCIAAGHDAADLVAMYSKRGKEIFSSRDWLDVLSGPSDEVFRANYDNVGLIKVVRDMLGKRSLSDLEKKVVITSFDLDNLDDKSRSIATRTYDRRFWKPKIFHNFECEGGDGDESALDVAIRTSAAPTYFPSYQGYIDGGIVANNPALCAVGRAVKAGISLNQMVLISVGTGTTPTYIKGDRLDWGYKQWLPKLMPLIMDGMVGIPDYVCEQLLPGRYARIHPFLQDEVELDDAARIDELIEWADHVDLRETIDLLTSLPA
ncbi:MAG: patatin-like phospholipase family protein [Nitrospira sp.]